MPTAVPRLHRLLPLLERLPLRSHFSALARLPFLPRFTAPQNPNLPRRPAQKIRPKLSLAGPPPLGAGRREIAPPSPPPKSHYPPLAAPLGTQPKTSDAAGCTRAAGMSTPAAPTRSRRRLPPNHDPLPPAPHPGPPLAARAPAPRRISPKCSPPHLKSFLEKTLTRARPPQNRPATPHQPQPRFVRFPGPNLELAIT